MEKILCSAIWIANPRIYPHQPKNIESGIVICGRRHCNCYATIAQTEPNLRSEALDAKYPIIEGFITTGNLFVNREIAAEIAFKAGQVPEMLTQLISENLY
jgi:hypothetical protein